MRLRAMKVGCFGGGTGLPSLLGGLKNNPWVRADAIVTMFDSGGSSGVLRDELGVLPPGDILKCALAMSRNAREARRVLLARLPTLEHARLGGHTGGNLLLSMMQRYSGDFLDAIDPVYQEAVEKKKPAGQHLVDNQGRVADALLAVTDRRAQQAQRQVVRSAYDKLRPMAKKQVEQAAPRMAKLLEKHAASTV